MFISRNSSINLIFYSIPNNISNLIKRNIAIFLFYFIFIINNLNRKFNIIFINFVRHSKYHAFIY